MPRVYFGLGLGLLFFARGALGAGSDAAAARAQLVQGYTLKQKGKCDEAIPYFTESIRLDRHPKALLNLADCEEKLRRLSAAQAHFVEAREVARLLGLPPYDKAAQDRLAALEKSIPRLVIRLAREAPRDSVVSRDGVELSQVSLNTPLPIDPGQHSVLVRTTSLERRYDVSLSEGEIRELEVTPIGGRSTLPTPVPVAPSSAESAESASSEATAQPPCAAEEGAHGAARSSRAAGSNDPRNAFGSEVESVPAPESSGAQKTVGFVVAGAGAVGLTLGIYYSVQFTTKNDALAGLCTEARPCADRRGYEEARDSAMTARTLSIAGLAGGAAALATGLVLLLTAPSSSPNGAGAPTLMTKNVSSASPAIGGWQWAPQFGSGVTGAVVGGTW